MMATKAIAVIASVTAALNFWAMPSRAQEPIWDANKIQLAPKTLAPNVIAMIQNDADAKAPKGIPLATVSGIILGSKSIMVVDTMLSRRLASQVLAEVEKLSKLPVRYALNTSFHGDHSYGNMFFPNATTIIQHEVTKQYIDANFKKDTEFMMGAFGKGRGIEEIRPRTGDILVPKGGKLTIDLGSKIVEVLDFGFAQTGGDLFVWIPTDKVLFVGNAIVAEKPALPWLLDGHLVETTETLKKVYAFLPAEAKVVPGHGRVMEREGLRWHIDYLTAVRNEVQQAVNKGMTLEQTVAAVTLPAFQGYAIFDWVHRQINVPAAYKELKR